MSHTPEPWHWEREPNGGYTVNTKLKDGEGIHVAYIAPDASAGAASIEAANAQRIVVCVNALAGLTDSEIDTMVQRWKERNR